MMGKGELKGRSGGRATTIELIKLTMHVTVVRVGVCVCVTRKQIKFN